MASPRPISRRRRITRNLLLVAGVLALAILGIHIWFVNNARGVLQDIVTSKSKGKLRLEMSELSFDFFSNKIKIRDADLVNNDTLSQPTTYHVKFSKLTLRVNSFWPLVLQKKLLLDSIKLHDPEIEVLQWREDTTEHQAKSNLSIPQEMGRLYNSMLDVLESFGIRRIMIDNAKVSLVNKMVAGTPPVTITNIYLDLFRSPEKSSRRDEYIEGEQDIALSTTDQSILLPGGRHRLSFKSFNLQLFRSRIVLDSCTVSVAETSTSKSSYDIFFTRLSLIGVDFNAMSGLNLIRADSVYCENPVFNIKLTPGEATAEKKETPDLGKIIQELTGDLDLAFIGVKDAGIHIDIGGPKSKSLFNSNKDDFEMRGLRINADSSKPVSVERFDMLVQDYHLYNEDSSTAYSFDSIRFDNNRIVLNNFTVLTSSARNRLRNQRDFSIPYFALSGLDWNELIFNQSMKAEEAYLFNPVINYVRRAPARKKKKGSLFASLQNLDNLVTLNKLNVVNGQINMKLDANTSFILEDADLALQSNKLLRSTNREGLLGAVDHFSFARGTIRLKDLTAQLRNVRYTGKSLVHAQQLTLRGRNNSMNAVVDDVYIDNMLLDDATETVIVDGIRWQKADIRMQAAGKTPGKKGGTGNLEIRKVAGGNTNLVFANEGLKLHTLVNSLRLASLHKFGDEPVRLNGLVVTGSRLVLDKEPLKLAAQSYHVASDGYSEVTGFAMQKITSPDSLTIRAPRVRFDADINSMLAKDMHVRDVVIHSPLVRINKHAAPPADKKEGGAPLRIDRLTVHEPDLNIVNHKNDSTTTISLPRSDNSVVRVSNFQMADGNLQIGGLYALSGGATFIQKTGEVMGVEKGRVEIDLSNIRLGSSDGKPTWSGSINTLDLENPNAFTFGKKGNRLVVQRASAGNVNLSSEYMSNFGRLVRFNISAWLRTTTGMYSDSTTTMKWFNANYNDGNRALTLDSFQYYPTQPLDSVIAKTPYQTDYITFKSHAIRFADFNLEEYEKDSAFIAKSLDIHHPVITIYRDKNPPFRSGFIKPLPTRMIKGIPLPVTVGRVNLFDGTLLYTEKNAKTRAEGTLSLNRITGGLANIHNRNLTEGDSLTFTLNAYLMDSARLNLRVRQSYLDTADGFIMTLRMQPTSLSFLNPVVAPLSNVIITSGVIDSLHLRAVGNDQVAVGQMNMYYHDLRIKLVKGGNEERSGITNRLATFLANALVIKKNNNGRMGLVYFERLRDRSFFNYIIKTTFSGMATSIGVKKNRKYKKQYEKFLEKRNLPPLEYE